MRLTGNFAPQFLIAARTRSRAFLHRRVAEADHVERGKPAREEALHRDLITGNALQTEERTVVTIRCRPFLACFLIFSLPQFAA